VVVPITAFNLLALDRYGGGGGRRRGTTTATTLSGGGGASFSTAATSRTVVSNWNWNLNLKQINRREDTARSRSRRSICNNITPNVHHKRHDVVVLGAVSLLAEEQEVPTAIAVAKEREKKKKMNQIGKAHPRRRRDDAADADVTTTQKQAQTHHHTHLDLEPHDAWIAHLDYTAFGKEVTLLGKHLLQQTGPADLEHLQKIVRWRNLAALLGLTTVWMTPNPLTAVALSTWSYASWTMIAHHTCHGGHDFKLKKEQENTDGNKRKKKKKKSRFTSRGFGVGLQNRIIDWLDWMLPEAWNIEHNRLHHYRLNEPHGDPDLVQRNFQSIRDNTRLPYFVKYTITALLSTIWKWYYYAPNTYKELKVQEWKKTGKPLPTGFDPDEAVTILALLKPSNKKTLHQLFTLGDVLKDVLGPLLVGRYVLIPTVLLCLGRVLGGSSVGVGQLWATNAMVNLLLGEVLTNMHSFATIVTNHAGPDMYTFDDAVIPKTGAFYVRQVVGSVNYHTGTDVNDFAHGFLNYQIEHHVWPHLSMLQYQRGAPQLKALCRKHGVPYVQENVFRRVKKTVDVAVGKTSMRIFPTQYEPAHQKAGRQGVTWKSTHGAIDTDE